MIEATKEFREAVVADARRTLIRATVDVSDPDTVYGPVEGSAQDPFSKPAQLINKVFERGDNYATLETNYWILDGSLEVYPDSPEKTVGEQGSLSEGLCGEDRLFEGDQWVKLTFENMSILQACSVHISGQGAEGYPTDLTVEIGTGSEVKYKKDITGNRETSVFVKDFTVTEPDFLKVTVKKWSLPNRRVRLTEVIAGLYERWDADKLASLNVKHQGDVSCLTLPYGTATIDVDNEDRRFEPQNKLGLFKSLEERQGVDLELGIELPDGTVEYKRLGVYYHYAGGWLTGNNSLTIRWNLADIVGLLTDRPFTVPEELPVTLGGWMAVIVAQLGVNFEKRWSLTEELANIQAEVRGPEDVEGRTCGNILSLVCMACGVWPRADAETGNLTAEKPRVDGGGELTLDNLESYPTIMANSQVASVVFTLNDEEKTKYTIDLGTAGDIKTVSNPFIRTSAQAETAAELMRAAFGGNKYVTTGRGDPSEELGDVDTVWLRRDMSARGRRVQQTFSFNGGVLRGCQSTLLEVPGQ